MAFETAKRDFNIEASARRILDELVDDDDDHDDNNNKVVDQQNTSTNEDDNTESDLENDNIKAISLKKSCDEAKISHFTEGAFQDNHQLITSENDQMTDCKSPENHIVIAEKASLSPQRPAVGRWTFSAGAAKKPSASKKKQQSSTSRRTKDNENTDTAKPNSHDVQDETERLIRETEIYLATPSQPKFKNFSEFLEQIEGDKTTKPPLPTSTLSAPLSTSSSSSQNPPCASAFGITQCSAASQEKALRKRQLLDSWKRRSLNLPPPTTLSSDDVTNNQSEAEHKDKKKEKEESKYISLGPIRAKDAVLLKSSIDVDRAQKIVNRLWVNNMPEEGERREGEGEAARKRGGGMSAPRLSVVYDAMQRDFRLDVTSSKIKGEAALQNSTSEEADQADKEHDEEEEEYGEEDDAERMRRRGGGGVHKLRRLREQLRRKIDLENQKQWQQIIEAEKAEEEERESDEEEEGDEQETEKARDKKKKKEQKRKERQKDEQEEEDDDPEWHEGMKLDGVEEDGDSESDVTSSGDDEAEIDQEDKDDDEATDENVDSADEEEKKNEKQRDSRIASSSPSSFVSRIIGGLDSSSLDGAQQNEVKGEESRCQIISPYCKPLNRHPLIIRDRAPCELSPPRIKHGDCERLLQVIAPSSHVMDSATSLVTRLKQRFSLEKSLVASSSSPSSKAASSSVLILPRMKTTCAHLQLHLAANPTEIQKFQSLLEEEDDDEQDEEGEEDEIKATTECFDPKSAEFELFPALFERLKEEKENAECDKEEQSNVVEVIASFLAIKKEGEIERKEEEKEAADEEKDQSQINHRRRLELFQAAWNSGGEEGNNSVDFDEEGVEDSFCQSFVVSTQQTECDGEEKERGGSGDGGDEFDPDDVDLDEEFAMRDDEDYDENAEDEKDEKEKQREVEEEDLKSQKDLFELSMQTQQENLEPDSRSCATQLLSLTGDNNETERVREGKEEGEGERSDKDEKKSEDEKKAQQEEREEDELDVEEERKKKLLTISLSDEEDEDDDNDNHDEKEVQDEDDDDNNDETEEDENDVKEEEEEDEEEQMRRLVLQQRFNRAQFVEDEAELSDNDVDENEMHGAGKFGDRAMMQRRREQYADTRQDLLDDLQLDEEALDKLKAFQGIDGLDEAEAAARLEEARVLREELLVSESEERQLERKQAQIRSELGRVHTRLELRADKQALARLQDRYLRDGELTALRHQLDLRRRQRRFRWGGGEREDGDDDATAAQFDGELANIWNDILDKTSHQNGPAKSLLESDDKENEVGRTIAQQRQLRIEEESVPPRKSIIADEEMREKEEDDASFQTHRNPQIFKRKSCHPATSASNPSKKLRKSFLALNETRLNLISSGLKMTNHLGVSAATPQSDVFFQVQPRDQ